METSPIDEQLLAAFRMGDTAAFETLDCRYRPRLTAYVMQRLDPDLQEAVDDIVQKTLQYLFTHAAVLTKPNTVIQSVLFNRAFRYTRDHWRDTFAPCRNKARTEPLPPQHTQGDRNHRTDFSRYRDIEDTRGAEKLAAHQEITEYMGLLTPAEAAIIRLVDLENHTVKSAATILHINLTTAQWRYRKAHEHLRNAACCEVA